MACDKGVSKLPATCNCHPHVGKVIPAEGLVLTALSVSNYVPDCGASPRRLVYFLRVEIWVGPLLASATSTASAFGS